MQPILINDDCNNYFTSAIHQLKEITYVVTDPPYGLNKSWKRTWFGNNGKSRLTGKLCPWDTKPAIDTVNILLYIGEKHIFWGGNFYPLPPTRCWLIWDKLQNNRGADCEMAWSNLDMGTRVFRMSRIDAYYNKAIYKKLHPAEKPIQLMEWCVSFLPKKNTVIFDPFMGCGSIGVAAVRNGFKFIGIEINKEYFDIAKFRIMKEQKG